MMSDGIPGKYIVKLRGLPFSTTKENVIDFLDGVEVLNGVDGVHLIEVRPNRPSGECYVEVGSEMDVEKAFKKDKEHMGSRYIEVFASDRQEMQWAMNHTFVVNGPSFIPMTGSVVKLRGLPFGCSKEDIVHFFDGLEVSPEGVSILSDQQGRSSGEAFVHFVDKESAERALAKDREKIGHRYIEIFRSSVQEVRAGMMGDMGGPRMGGGGGGGRPTPYDRFPNRFNNSGRGMRPMPNRGGYRDYDDDGGQWGRGGLGSGGGGLGSGGGGRGGGASWRPRPHSGGLHSVHMRGLPFKATPSDIAYFFKPLRPVNINILFDNNRPSGEADVEFECHDDAVRAMRKDKTSMEHRYIELFLNSSPGGSSNGGGGGGGFRGGYQNSRNSYRNNMC